jgi:hypothetical protein
MGRILILDRDHTDRAQLVDGLQRLSSADAVVVSSDAELISHVQYGIYDAVFADAELLEGNLPLLVDAVRSAIARPMLIVASNETHRDLDGDLVTLIVRKPYDVGMVTGMLLSAILGIPGADAAGDDPTIRTT